MRMKIDCIVEDSGKDVVYVQFLDDREKVREKHCLAHDEKFEEEITKRYEAFVAKQIGRDAKAESLTGKLTAIESATLLKVEADIAAKSEERP